MGNVGDIERITQNRVVKLFKEKLGYTYLGNWEDRTNNSNIKEELLIRYLTKKGYNQTLITKALYELGIAANNYNENLYTNNKNVYKLLRHGVQVSQNPLFHNYSISTFPVYRQAGNCGEAPKFPLDFSSSAH